MRIEASWYDRCALAAVDGIADHQINFRVIDEGAMGFSKLPDDFEIAPGYTVSAWKELSLDETTYDTEDWGAAIRILETRLDSRFLAPAQILIEVEKRKKRGTNGFAILAIDFLLIETIQGFRKGYLTHNGRSRNLFKSFLTGWKAFMACVPDDMNAEDLAGYVYEQGRCALHHTGPTDRVIVRKTGKMFVFHKDGRIEINRSLLHGELTKEFDSYLADLGAPHNVDLRIKFKAKMDHICS